MSADGSVEWSNESTESLPRTALGEPVEAVEAAFFLVAQEDGRDGRWIELGVVPIAMGRGPHLALVLADGQISRLHALASVADGTVIIEDLGSTNGTYIDGRRVEGRAQLFPGSILAIGPYAFRCERRPRRDMERAEAHRRDVDRAAGYVAALLPPPLNKGPVRTEWMFRPSEELGGDAFGYEWLDDDTFVMFVLDVSGHGVTAAMHSVSVLNVLRQRALNADLRDPAAVLGRLNAMFPMERHHDQYFTMWFGCYTRSTRSLAYAAAGHHPGFLVTGAAVPVALRSGGPMIGAVEEIAFKGGAVTVPKGARLYLFSDGAFEIVTAAGRWRLDDFVARLDPARCQPGRECDRLYAEVRAASASGTLDDDLSLLVVTFS